MKKIRQLFILMAAKAALGSSFKRFAFLSIAIMLSYTASATQYCGTVRNSVSPNTTYTLNYTCQFVSGTTYQMKLDFTNTVSSISNANIGANPGGVSVAANPVWTNSNKTLTYNFSTTSAPSLYVATIFVIISGTEVRWDLPLDANFTAVCTPAPVFGTFTVGPKVVGAADSTITAPTSTSTGAFTYTSSNTNVATISGTTLHIVGFTGTSTITASQAADSGHQAGSTTATLTVTSPNPNPTFGTFTVGPKLTSDANSTITPPTTNSTGAFSYTSSNTAVATIVSGNQLHIVGSGTSTITATEAADANYNMFSTTATLTVTVPAPPTAAPNPPARNSWDVISYYSDTNVGSVYAVTSTPTWSGNPGPTDSPISGNATKYLGN